jgi:broad specificity phosphatase PhoE
VIYLARHGETDDNARGVVQGWIDTPLNKRGREQALMLANRVRGLGIAAIWTSQLARAVQTAEIVGDAIGVEARVDERFAESRRGTWEGRGLAEIEGSEPHTWLAWKRGGAQFRFPGGGESLGEHQKRVLEALAQVRRGALPALVTAHGGSIRCALSAQDGRGLEDFWSIRVPNATLFELPPEPAPTP